jgi:hypothetical protein
VISNNIGSNSFIFEYLNYKKVVVFNGSDLKVTCYCHFYYFSESKKFSVFKLHQYQRVENTFIPNPSKRKPFPICTFLTM